VRGEPPFTTPMIDIIVRRAISLYHSVKSGSPVTFPSSSFVSVSTSSLLSFPFLSPLVLRQRVCSLAVHVRYTDVPCGNLRKPAPERFPVTFAPPEAALLGFPSSLEPNFGLDMFHT
jgi:hypothetical protein